MLSERLSELRKEKKMRQEDLAKRLGIARTTYGMYEQGKREPDYDTLQKLADFFDVSVDYLLGRTSAPIENQSDDDEEFQKFINDPDLQRWYKELPKSKEEDLRRLRKLWEIIKNEDSDN